MIFINFVLFCYFNNVYFIVYIYVIFRTYINYINATIYLFKNQLIKIIIIIYISDIKINKIYIYICTHPFLITFENNVS